MKEFTLSELGVFLGVVGGIVTSVLLTIPEKQVQEHQVLRLRVRPRPDAAERNPLRGGGAPAVDGSIDGIQQASGHIEGVPTATYNLPLSPKLPVASNDSGPLRPPPNGHHRQSASQNPAKFFDHLFIPVIDL
eukprot:COSAG02_NODE_17130_length_1026_cov_1.345200_2_plen_133_part_00